MIKAVTFDFWGTLYHDTEEASGRRRQRRIELLQPLFDELGLNNEPRQIQAALDTTAFWLEQVWSLQESTPTSEELGVHLAVQLGRRITHEQAVRIMDVVSSVVVEIPPTVNPDAPTLLPKLAGRYACGIISDTGFSRGRALREILRGHGLLDCFRVTTFSDETLTAKPATRQFLGTLMGLDARPEQAVHVGDLERTDVAGAKAVGMWAVRIDGGWDSEVDATDSQADAVIRSLDELPALLEAWG